MKARYQKPEAVKELEILATEAAKARHPGNPYVIDRIFRDDTANRLTDCIVKYIDLKGGWASRTGNQGTYSQKLGRYIPSTSKRGLPDIMGTYKNRSLYVEVKTGRDVMSDHQKKVQEDVTRAGGTYYLARDFESFKQFFDTL
jgi:hypothetical protein